MKNITLSADNALIQEARKRASSQNTTVNELFREWLAKYVAQDSAAKDYEALMSDLSHIQSNGPYSRDELNERH